MIYKKLVDSDMVRGTEHGHVEKPISKLSVGAESLEQVSLAISDEYAKLVQEFPEYEFGILADNLQSTIRVTWRRRE